MKITHHNIQKQARVVLLGSESDAVERLWIVLHGYGQLATYFARKFEPIDDGKTLVVVPEGLHRFYLNGFSGRVGASWMTKEDRLTDIADNHQYLNQLFEHYQSAHPKARIGIIGFSQGAATAVRWFCQSAHLPDRLVIWSGAFPDDLNWFDDIPVLNQRPLTFVLGDNDEFYDEERIEQQSVWLQSKNLQFNTIRFKGGHDIDPETLISVHHSL